MASLKVRSFVCNDPFGHSTYSDRLNVRVRYAHVAGEQAGNCSEGKRKARRRVYRSDSALPNTSTGHLQFWTPHRYRILQRVVCGRAKSCYFVIVDIQRASPLPKYRKMA